MCSSAPRVPVEPGSVRFHCAAGQKLLAGAGMKEEEEEEKTHTHTWGAKALLESSGEKRD